MVVLQSTTKAVEGCKGLNLGSGTGLDCFVLTKLVGSRGHVTGIDLTKEQVSIGQSTIQSSISDGYMYNGDMKLPHPHPEPPHLTKDYKSMGMFTSLLTGSPFRSSPVKWIAMHVTKH